MRASKNVWGLTQTVTASSYCNGMLVKSTAKGKLLFQPPKGFVSYEKAGKLQESYVRKWLDFKAGKADIEKPDPLLLAFEMNPVYTAGRRQMGKLSAQEIEHFKCEGKAEFIESQRGGQTTFHGPGQLVMYPIVDLREAGIKVRCYVRLLENSIIETLQTYGIKSYITDDTGVWVSPTEKVAAIGIHVRRSITSHGLALNVNTDPFWFERIVACGLPDKSTTTMVQLGVNASVTDVANTLASRLASNLKLELECI